VKISVVIPSFDGSRGGNVARLKEQLSRQTIPPHEVIVVVGVSPNGRARNEGVKQASGNYFVLIDDDVTLGNDHVLESLIRPFLERDDIGMTGPAQLVPEDSQWWQKMASRQIPRNHFPIQKELVDSDMVSHMCLAMPAALFKQVGEENAEIVAGTDPDLRHRVRQAGLRVCVVPDCWAYHPMPSTFSGLLGQSFAKGRNSAIVRRTHPELVLELDAGHRAVFPARRPLAYRVLRLATRLLACLLTGRLFYLAFLLAYGSGNLSETFSPTRPHGMPGSLGPGASLVIAMLAGLGLFFLMPWGPGVSPDSTTYLNVAENLAAGKGLVVDLYEPIPLAHFPPLYPLFIAMIMTATGSTVLMAVRIGNALTYAVNLLLVGQVMRRCGGSSWQTLAGMLLLGCAEPLLLLHLMAWSEPLFLALGLLCLLSLGDFLHGDAADCRRLVAAGLAAGAACLARYVGVTLILTGIAALLSVPAPRSWWKRLTDSAMFAGIAILPLMLWSVRNHLVAGTATNRQFGFHPISHGQINQLIRSGLFILLPDAAVEPLKAWRMGSPQMLLVALGCGMALLLAGAFRWRRPLLDAICGMAKALPVHARLLALFLPIYGGFLLFSISCLDANTPLDYRITAPAVAALLLLLPWLARSGTLPARVLLALLAVLLMTYPLRALHLAYHNIQDGQGYTGRMWRESTLLATLRQLPPETPVYSNGQAAIRFLLNRRTLPLPARSFAAAGRENPHFFEEMMAMGKAMAEQDARIVFFKNIPEGSAPSYEETAAMLPLEVEMAAVDGILCRAATPKKP
jgi:GT2 family glycosyltransferase/4-amino-4-deoxy-L-arabinose transferase-like glycosyltransferase